MPSTSSTAFHAGVQDITNDQWSGMLTWPSGETEVSASVQATDTVLDPMLSTWPTHLLLEIIATGVHTLDIQELVLQHKAPVARIQCTPEMDNRDFGELINSLRERNSVAIVRWEIREEGSPRRGLVLAPLHGALLCAAFLASDMPELPMAPSQRPRARQDEQRCLLEFRPALVDGLVPAVAS